MKTFCNLRMLLPGSSIIISSLSRLIRTRAEKTAHAHTRHPHKLESEIITPLICQIGGRADFKIIKKKEGRRSMAKKNASAAHTTQKWRRGRKKYSTVLFAFGNSNVPAFYNIYQSNGKNSMEVLLSATYNSSHQESMLTCSFFPVFVLQNILHGCTNQPWMRDSRKCTYTVSSITWFDKFVVGRLYWL